MEALKNCRLCPRNCGINRFSGETGMCLAGSHVLVGKAMLHAWEEPFISGKNGSGAVFFSNCNLRCEFCQNQEISQGCIGKSVSIERLSEIFLELQSQGAHNINLVTPTHYAPQIKEALTAAKSGGLVIPIVYNTNSYENIETIQMLSGLIDIYLPDLKYFNNIYSIKYSHAPNYFKYATLSIEEMFKSVGELEFNSDGLLKKGVVIRHLAIPGLLSDSKMIIDYIAAKFGNSVYLSLMNQYTPLHNAKKHPEISAPLTEFEYEQLIDYCLSLGLENVLIQESGTSTSEYVPSFDLSGI